MSVPEFNNPAGVAPPVGAYSHAGWIKAGSDVLFIAGVGVGRTGSWRDFHEQADEPSPISRILSGNGQPMHLVKLNVFVVYGQPVNVVRDARRKHFGDIRPASTFIYVPQLVEPKYLIEVEGVAARWLLRGLELRRRGADACGLDLEYGEGTSAAIPGRTPSGTTITVEIIVHRPAMKCENRPKKPLKKKMTPLRTINTRPIQ
jgi:enamine deaminase RidA (YjgF/YER057c/UK114 family)